MGVDIREVKRTLAKGAPVISVDTKKNVGTDHDTAAFAVASIRGWWRQLAGKVSDGLLGVCAGDHE